MTYAEKETVTKSYNICLSEDEYKELESDLYKLKIICISRTSEAILSIGMVEV